jgi:hypothetical protein
MPTIRHTYTSRATLEDVLDIHFGTANVTEMAPSYLAARCNSDEAVLEGVLVNYRFRLGIFPFKCTMRYVSVNPDYGYTVVMYRGPLKRYEQHVGITLSKAGGVTVYHRISYSFKPGLRGWFLKMLIRRGLVRTILRASCNRMERILARAAEAKEKR